MGDHFPFVQKASESNIAGSASSVCQFFEGLGQVPLIDLCRLVHIIVFDIKAGNVLLDQDGVTAKITGVGLSKMLAGSNTATLLVCADPLSCLRLMPQSFPRPIIINLLPYPTI